MRDKLPSKPLQYERMIVNLDDSANSGTHWVALVKEDRSAFYFDSYGDLQPPLEIVEYLGDGVDIRYNTTRYQNFNTEICGHLCLAFLV